MNTEYSPKYLQKPIVQVKHTETPRYGVTREGYSVRSGAPSHVMVRLEGERVWRRVFAWCFSNASTLFVRVKGECLIVRDLPALESSKAAE